MTVELMKRIKAPLANRVMAKSKTPHQMRVEAFMAAANQMVPDRPCVPIDEVRILRAKLIFEEAMETINALGVEIQVAATWNDPLQRNPREVQIPLNTPCPEGKGDGTIAFHDFNIVAPCNLGLVADGCADVLVVTTGTLSACGIADEMIQTEVDYNNLAKFGEGHSIREDGKLVKPPGHPAPEINEILVMQGALPSALK